MSIKATARRGRRVGKPSRGGVLAGLLLAGCLGDGEATSDERGGGCGGEGPPCQVRLAEESCCCDDGPCQDGLFCNGREQCNCWGECEPADPAFTPCAESYDVCLTVACDERLDSCVHTPVSGCCRDDASCDDGDACTVDRCDAARATCSFEPISCDDGDRCTIDSCLPARGCSARWDGWLCGVRSVGMRPSGVGARVPVPTVRPGASADPGASDRLHPGTVH